MQSDDFPLLRSTLARSRFSEGDLGDALANIAQGIQEGEIRNAVLKDANNTLSRIVDHAWRDLIADRLFGWGRSGRQSRAANDLYMEVNVMGLHDVIAASKRVHRSEATGPAVAAMRAFCDEVLPLSLAVTSLRSKVTSGRLPSTAPAKPVNPAKVVQTCPVCFRQVAVVNGKMAHHGYQRPGLARRPRAARACDSRRLKCRALALTG